MSRPSSRPVGLWLLAAVGLAASASFVGWRILGPSDVATIAFYGDAWQPQGVLVEPFEQGSRLAHGDVVLAIDGRPINEWLAGAADPTLPRTPTVAGAEHIYTVGRDGSTMDVEVVLVAPDAAAYLAANWANLLLGFVLLGLGLYVLAQRPEVSAARAFVLAALGAGGSVLPWTLGMQASDLYLGWPFLLYAVTVGPLYMLLWPAGGLHLPLALTPRPDGVPPSRRQLVAAYGIPLGAYAVLLLIAALVSPSPTAWIGTWPVLQGLIIVPTLVTGLLLMTRAYRRASAEAQRQLRWALVGGGSAGLVGLALMFGPQLFFGRPLLPWSAIGLIALPLPIGMAVAIVRHRLFDIEVVVNRTLVYGGLTLLVLAIYTTAVLVLGALVPQGAGFPAALLATGVAAVAALPLRDLLQRGVNRLMYGDRDDPYRALARLGTRLQAALDPIETPNVIVRTVAESLRLPWAGLRFGTLDAGAGGRLVEHGSGPLGAVTTVPLVYGAEVVGDLLVAQRSSTEPLADSDRRLLEALARQAGPAVHAIGLTRDLIESRQQLVAAREEERRRIRRDLHDGLGPTLAGIGLRAEVAADLAGTDPAGAEETLRQLTTDVHGALAEIRRLVDGLRPPSLDELGLVGAIRAQADRLGPTPTFEFAGDDLPELPAAIEVAAYRICVEAMTNAARHAGAQHCRVFLNVVRVGGARLSIEVRDDGRGLSDRRRPGIGIASMRLRAEEVGGGLELRNTPGGGTMVRAELPLPAAVS